MACFITAPSLLKPFNRTSATHQRHPQKHFKLPTALRRPVSTKRPRAIPRPPDPTDEYSPQKLGFLHIATITGAHGVRGEVKAQAATDFAQYRLGAGAYTRTKHFLLLPNRKYPRPVTVTAGRKASQEDAWILRLKDVNTREEVDALRGSGLFVKEDDRPKLGRNEYLVGDVVGMRVEVEGEDVGFVAGVMTREEICRAAGSGKRGAAVGNDLLEVELDEEEGKRVLVPFVMQVVPVVDKERGVIQVDPPEGLFEIAVVNRKEKKAVPRGLLMPVRE